MNFYSQVCGWRAVYRFPLRIRIDNRRLSDHLVRAAFAAVGCVCALSVAVRVQSGLRSYVISTPGCECGLCAVYDFPGKPVYETGSAGVWDRRSLCEGGRDGFDKSHLWVFFNFLFFRANSFLLMISLARLGDGLKTGRDGSGENFLMSRMF